MVVGCQTRLGRIQLSKPQAVSTPTGIHRVVDASGELVWRDEQDKVECIVLLHKGRVLFNGTLPEFLQTTGKDNPRDAFRSMVGNASDDVP